MEQENNKSETALREEKILEFWKENKIFEKSLKKKSPKGDYVFYDGPPFATGTPHYGHILGSTVKDVIGRYQTMRGYRVPRRWGWDCHGLPIENIVEKDLGISGKKSIEELGIDKFVEHARSKVLTYVAEWRKTIERMGRWVDFDNSYKTMDNTFIESVWWALGEMNKKGLLYEGVRVLAYCPRCETPIANSEIAMDNSYKDIADISVYVKFKLKNEENTYLIAWTTTPWTLPGNTAIAVNKNFIYVCVSNDGEKGKENLILSADCFEKLKDKFQNPKIVKEVKGSELLGLAYEPIFDFYKNSDVATSPNAWKVWHADFVTVDQGTGIAHEAPAFGEDDMNLAREHQIPWIIHVDNTGSFRKEVVGFAGLKVKPKDTAEDKDAHLRTDIEIIKYLQEKGAFFAKEKITHSYPHCYRCDTPLLYYALPSWFVNIQKAKKGILQTGKYINWVPSYLKEGRYKNIVESAPDWTISRNRYWASPLPFWKSASGKIMFVNGLEDLKSKTKKSGNKYFAIRHAQAKANLQGLISNKIESDNDHLTEEGKKQAVSSAKQLKKENITLVISSDFLRTKETAEVILRELNLPQEKLFFDKHLREVSTGSFKGKTWKEYWGGMSERDRYFLRAGGSETHRDVKRRVSDFLYDIERKYQNENILIVTHEGPRRLIVAGSLGLNDEETIRELSSSIPPVGYGEIREFSFVPLPHNENFELDLHRPYIDAITLVDEKGEEYRRIPEVIDCWFESGSMPFAQDHYPFEKPDWKNKNFPAGFVAEYIAQTRTWFYYTHAISSILFGKAPFKNVVTTGTVLAEDGQKMSKSKNNFPDPALLFDKYGVDALRFYLMSCPVMKGEDINFSEKSVQEISNKIINRFNNVIAFYELYPLNSRDKSNKTPKSENVLDRWVMYRLEGLVYEATDGMEKYDMVLSTRPFELFIEDLSTWYLRRSRERIKNGDREAKLTLYFVLKTLARLLAPFTPFVSESVWLKLKNDNDPESVHLAEWPKTDRRLELFEFFKSDLKKTKKVLLDMAIARKIVSIGLEARQKAGIKVRQTLSSLKWKAENRKSLSQYINLIKDELNVKEVFFDKRIEHEVILDTTITPELKQEGNYRELIRELQDIRKKMKLTPSDLISIIIHTNDVGKKLIQKFESELLRAVLALSVELKENDGEEVKIDDLEFKIKIEK